MIESELVETRRAASPLAPDHDRAREMRQAATLPGGLSQDSSRVICAVGARVVFRTTNSASRS